MPFIEVTIVEGVLPDDKKHELIAALTNAVVNVGGDPTDSIVFYQRFTS